MQNLRRTFAPVALIVLAGLVVWPLRDVFDAFIDSRSFASPITWMLGMTWGFDFAWSIVLGALLGAVLRSTSAMLYGTATPGRHDWWFTVYVSTCPRPLTAATPMVSDRHRRQTGAGGWR